MRIMERIAFVLEASMLSFFDGQYSTEELKSFYIGGSYFSNLYNFFLNHPELIEADMKKFRKQYLAEYPGTDLDIYIDAISLGDWKMKSHKILKEYHSTWCYDTVDRDTAHWEDRYKNISQLINVKDKNCIVNDIQIINCEFGPPEEVFARFDCEHAKIAYNVGKAKFEMFGNSWDAVINRKLIMNCDNNRTRHPHERVEKLKSRNWNHIELFGSEAAVAKCTAQPQSVEMDEIPF